MDILWLLIYTYVLQRSIIGIFFHWYYSLLRTAVNLNFEFSPLIAYITSYNNNWCHKPLLLGCLSEGSWITECFPAYTCSLQLFSYRLKIPPANGSITFNIDLYVCYKQCCGLNVFFPCNGINIHIYIQYLISIKFTPIKRYRLIHVNGMICTIKIQQPIVIVWQPMFLN